MAIDERSPRGVTTTHIVQNQPPPLEDYNVFTRDRALVEGVRRADAGWAEPQLRELGTRAGSAEAIQWGFDANANEPILHTHDRYGHRIDEVTFHPAWHALLNAAVAYGLHAAPWRGPRPGAHVARAASFYLWSQVEAGHGCPISMTYAAVPALRRQPELAEMYESRITSLIYDPGLRPLETKRGILCGMGMTEKQGGSDVRANTTTATPLSSAGPGAAYRLTGHKWFCSAPMCDVFLMLAQTSSGLSCFLVPRVLPDGTRNPFLIQRLKDKLGNRSNASSEIELEDTIGYLINEEGRGVRTIVEMVNCTRLDCIIGTAANMRQAVAQALHHAQHRQVFGKQLIDQPLMRMVLADLALESEAATAVMLRLAAAADLAEHDPHEALMKRLGTAIAKFYVTKRGPALAAEAMECLGGNGYVEESIMPRIYREVPVNSIWEGSGNVNCLDTLRAMRKEPAALPAYFHEVEMAAGRDADLDAAITWLRGEITAGDDFEPRARRVITRMAQVLQAALLVRHSTPEVARAFCASRLAGNGGWVFGDLPDGLAIDALVERAWPNV